MMSNRLLRYEHLLTTWVQGRLLYPPDQHPNSLKIPNKFSIFPTSFYSGAFPWGKRPGELSSSLWSEVHELTVGSQAHGSSNSPFSLGSAGCFAATTESNTGATSIRQILETWGSKTEGEVWCWISFLRFPVTGGWDSWSLDVLFEMERDLSFQLGFFKRLVWWLLTWFRFLEIGLNWRIVLGLMGLDIGWSCDREGNGVWAGLFCVWGNGLGFGFTAVVFVGVESWVALSFESSNLCVWDSLEKLG